MPKPVTILATVLFCLMTLTARSQDKNLSSWKLDVCRQHLMRNARNFKVQPNWLHDEPFDVVFEGAQEFTYCSVTYRKQMSANEAIEFMRLSSVYDTYLIMRYEYFLNRHNIKTVFDAEDSYGYR